MPVLPETPVSVPATGRKARRDPVEHKLVASLADARLHEPSPASTMDETPSDHSAPSTPEQGVCSDSGVNVHHAPGTNGSWHESVVVNKELDDPFMDCSQASTPTKNGLIKHVTGLESTCIDDYGRVRPLKELSIKSEPGLELEPAVTNAEARRGTITEPLSADNAQALLPPKACVFVANLSSVETDIDLTRAVHEVFDRFGKVWIKIRRDNGGMPFAFCQYEEEEDARKAIVNGRSQMIHGRPCRTEPAKVNRSIFISKLTGDTVTESEAREALLEFGPIESLWWPSQTERAMYQLPEGVWIKFGYFQDCRDVQSAFRGHSQYRVEQPSAMESRRPATGDTQTRSRFHQPGVPNDGDRRSLFIGNLPTGITRDRLVQEFRQYGNIRSVDVVMRRAPQGGGARYFGFVELSNHEEAANAMKGHNGRVIDGRAIRIEPKESTEGAARRITRAPALYKAPALRDNVQDEIKRNSALLEQQRQMLAMQGWHLEQANSAHGMMGSHYGPPHVMPSNGPPMSPAPAGSNGAPHSPWPLWLLPPFSGPTSNNGNAPHPNQQCFPGHGQIPHNPNPTGPPTPASSANNTQGTNMGHAYPPVPPMGQYQYSAPFYHAAPPHFPMQYPPTPDGAPPAPPMANGNPQMCGHHAPRNAGPESRVNGPELL